MSSRDEGMRPADPTGRADTRAGADEAGHLPQPSAPATGGTFPAWEQIEAGRYMPRRTRGSFPGRELG